MKLALEIPVAYWNELSPLADALYITNHVVNPTYATLLKATRKDKYLAIRPEWDWEVIGRMLETVEPTHVVVKGNAHSSQANLVEVIRVKNLLSEFGCTLPLIGIHRGGWNHLDTLRHMTGYVALHWDSFREKVLRKFPANEFYFVGFKNLGELRVHKPKYMLTSAPITAAHMGVDLGTRERRPRALAPFASTLSLTANQLRLARKNITLIKETANDSTAQNAQKGDGPESVECAEAGAG